MGLSLTAEVVNARACDLSCLNQRTHITRRGRTLSELFKLSLWLQLLRWVQKLIFGNILAIDAVSKLALFGRISVRQKRSPSIDEGLNLLSGQASWVDDRAVFQVSTIYTFWVYHGKAGATVEIWSILESRRSRWKLRSCRPGIPNCLCSIARWKSSAAVKYH